MAGLPTVKYSGRIREITIGKPGTEVVVGGENVYPYYSFEGANPHTTKLALQVLDTPPQEWAEAALDPFKDVLDDPVAWARKCVEEYDADMIALWLMGSDPNGLDLPAERCAEVARNVAEAINKPLIVWGVSSDDKNRETLKAVCEACEGLNVAIGPVTENNYKQIGAAAIAYKHVVVANSPIDINLAKQLNILLENLGMPEDRIIIDPTTSSVGYGMEYCYSIMERIRQSALCQDDEKLQYPILNNIAEEVWKVKEAKLPKEDNPALGDAVVRGINLEAVTAVSMLLAGSDILILRHPETLKHVRKYISEMILQTDLESMQVDLSITAESPKPSAGAAPTTPQPAAPSKAAAPRKAGAPPKAAASTRPAPPKPAAPKPAVKRKPPAKPKEVVAKTLEEKRSVEMIPALKTGELQKTAKLSVKEAGPPATVESAASPGTENELALIAQRLEEQGVSDTVFSRLAASVQIFRELRSLEERLVQGASEGRPFEEIDAPESELETYRTVADLAAALDVIAAKLDEAELQGVEPGSLEYSKEDLERLRVGIKRLRTVEGPESAAVDKGGLELREVDFTEEEVEALRSILNVFRKGQRIIQGIAGLFNSQAS